MTRDEMQSEALTIKCLLNAAMAMRNAPDPNDETILLIEMAHQRAAKLNTALDAIND
ncbi:hypothetical protein I5192_03080 [Ruegeria sp. SCSIO 43209]|uniref:hypothetical protein n=1 Tax=Ruegeria sp. SCSIO 43209 TaxID=2793010 RepID=UPI001CA7C825|nr:hypothetical protein [Ruegeria sp. SCSIO 43209]UAB89682.1 hypothetical protein I5192_03080 [Ruegeria sp. SCSIO 43209]